MLLPRARLNQTSRDRPELRAEPGNYRLLSIRACLGVFPVQRLKAWVKALVS
jgi:hypothetical protein